MPAMINKLFGTKIKIVSGYKGGNDVYLAMERGEVHGRCGGLKSSIKSTRPDWFPQKKVSVPIQIALERDPEFPDAPALIEFAKDEKTKQILQLVLSPMDMDRPILAPPGTPPRSGRGAAQGLPAPPWRDPGLIADAKKAQHRARGDRGREDPDDPRSRLCDAGRCHQGSEGRDEPHRRRERVGRLVQIVARLPFPPIDLRELSDAETKRRHSDVPARRARPRRAAGASGRAVLGARKTCGAWSIPKGNIPRADEALATAVREFAEETGKPSTRRVPAARRDYAAGPQDRHGLRGRGRFRFRDAQVEHLRAGMAAEEWPQDELSQRLIVLNGFARDGAREDPLGPARVHRPAAGDGVETSGGCREQERELITAPATSASPAEYRTPPVGRAHSAPLAPVPMR